MNLLEQLLRVIAPHHCVACGAEGGLLCTSCATGLATVPSRCYRCGRATAAFRTCAGCAQQSALGSVIPITTYSGPAKDIIHRLKFERTRAAADDIAAVMAARLDSAATDIITYVPTAPARVRTRGYDQAQLIARAVAVRTRRPCLALLARRSGLRQLGQDRSTRQQQVRDAFIAVRPGRCSGSRILLIDDVLTTGATCEAAARALRQAGAIRIDAAVFAAA